MISRTIVIAIAFIAGGYRLTQGAWVDATGLTALGAGLLLLRFGKRPETKRWAWMLFVVTAAAVATSLARRM
jgi:hypothetical protein